jgi:hypothetical protein
MKNKLKIIFSTFRPDANTFKTLSQFAVEFSGPAVIAAAWTGWEWHKADADYKLISSWAIHFFAAGWAFTQWNRIKKQRRSEDGLLGVAKNTESLIRQLNRSTNKMFGAATGGDSFCAVEPINITQLVPQAFILNHLGDYPLYDVDVRIVDLKRLKEHGISTSHDNTYHYKILIPDHSVSLNLKVIPNFIGVGETRRYNIFYTARNGSFMQSMQMQNVDGKLLHASIFYRDGEVFFEAVEHGYPKNAEKIVDWAEKV